MIEEKVEKKEFTIGEFLDAMEANGLPKVTGALYRTRVRGQVIGLGEGRANDPTIKIGAGCAIGQANINLGIVDYNSNEEYFWEVRRYVVEQNDKSGTSVPDIARRARKRFKRYLDVKVAAKPFDYTPYLDMEVYKKKDITNE